jgi:integrase
VTLAHNALTRAIRHAEANRHVMHNVGVLVDTPKGQPGRPSKALNAEQAAAVLKAAAGSRLGAYVVLCLLTGIRTEEARALRWDHVDLDAASIAVWRSVRLGGDTKTAKSRRTLGLPRTVVGALREHRMRQDEDRLAAGELWTDHGLVFTTEVGTELDAASVRRSFRSVCRAADIGEGCACRRSNAPIRIICAQPSARATRLSAARNRQGELPSKQRGSRRQARSLRCPSNVPAIRPAVAAVGLLEAHRQPQDRMLRSRPQRRSP